MIINDHQDRQLAGSAQPSHLQAGAHGTSSRSTPPLTHEEVTTTDDSWEDGADWVAEPIRWTVGDEHPELMHLTWLSVDAAELRPILLYRPSGHLVVEWLHNNGCYLIGDVLDLTDEEIRDWPGIGKGKQASLLEFFGDVASNALSLLEARINDLTNPEASSVDSPMHAGLAKVAAWARLSAEARTWGDVRDALVSAPIPEDVHKAVADLAAWTLPREPSLRSAEDLASAWLGDLDERDFATLQGRLLESPASTLDEIGKRFGVSRERIRQLESKLKKCLGDLLHEDSWCSIRWRIFDIRERLGVLAPIHHPAALPIAQDDDLTPVLLLWLAGYRREADCLRRDRYFLPELSSLPRLQPELPLLDEDQIRTALIADGVKQDLLDWAITSISGLARRDGQLVAWPRSIVEKSYAILATRGTPMTAEELAVEVGGEVSVRSLRQRLFEDPRMVRVSRSTIGLRAWGGEEYTTLVDIMCTALEEQGPMPTPALIEDLVRRFGANPTSVLAYSAAPVFVVEAGKIRLRRPEEPYHPRVDPAQVPGLYRDGSDHLVWNIAADHDLMRGSGRALPAEIATFLGLTAGTRLLLSNPVRDVPISWLETSHIGPNIGSLKALAAYAGAQQGDHLHVQFDRLRTAISVKVSPDRPDAVTIAAQIAWLTGLPIYQCRDRADLANAVQVQPTSLIATLRGRGDVLVSELTSQLL